MNEETIKPKEAAIRYNVKYTEILNMCKDGRLPCLNKGSSARATFLIYLHKADKYMESIGWSQDSRKKQLTNESPMETLVGYIESQSNEVKKKGVKPLKSILRSIQKSSSYKEYPVSTREAICILLDQCIQFEESVDKCIALLYED